MRPPQPRRPFRLRSLPKDLRHAARIALRAGWSIRISPGTSHTIWRAPTGQTIVCSSSPSDPTNTTIVCRLLRKAGLRI